MGSKGPGLDGLFILVSSLRPRDFEGRPYLRYLSRKILDISNDSTKSGDRSGSVDDSGLYIGDPQFGSDISRCGAEELHNG